MKCRAVLMNDESGGLCWNGPEAIAEIIYNVPHLIEQYGIILASFLKEEPFEAGTRRAISRIGFLKPEIFADSGKMLAASLNDDDPVVRGLSIKALAAIGDSTAGDKVESLKEDNAVLEEYDFETSEIKKVTVGHLAANYLQRMKLQT